MHSKGYYTDFERVSALLLRSTLQGPSPDALEKNIDLPVDALIMKVSINYNIGDVPGDLICPKIQDLSNFATGVPGATSAFLDIFPIR
ncbi:hypothetical protein CERSUDRAFT_100591 [Gelatoporia subvermispora B]|uniref:Uncharacterized protein n=1 Tax=Ceriporiopsis subvermispora (strain B) TaxID=914234 RepID=M2P7D1_CERS8|nr:hypothetical protein CERSUDRAFT_100591 [Gelatoporia subvermispora B]